MAIYPSARWCTDAYCTQHSSTAIVQNTHLPFFLGYSLKTIQSLTPMTTTFRESHSNNSMSNKTE